MREYFSLGGKAANANGLTRGFAVHQLPSQRFIPAMQVIYDVYVQW